LANRAPILRGNGKVAGLQWAFIFPKADSERKRLNRASDQPRRTAMRGRNLLVVFAAAACCVAAPAWAGQQTPAQHGSRAQSDCPQKRAQAAKWKKPAGVVKQARVSAGGGVPILTLRRFAPDILP
jgi:hypothetical protein